MTSPPIKHHEKEVEAAKVVEKADGIMNKFPNLCVLIMPLYSILISFLLSHSKHFFSSPKFINRPIAYLLESHMVPDLKWPFTLYITLTGYTVYKYEKNDILMLLSGLMLCLDQSSFSMYTTRSFSLVTMSCIMIVNICVYFALINDSFSFKWIYYNASAIFMSSLAFFVTPEAASIIFAIFIPMIISFIADYRSGILPSFRFIIKAVLFTFGFLFIIPSFIYIFSHMCGAKPLIKMKKPSFISLLTEFGQHEASGTIIISILGTFCAVTSNMLPNEWTLYSYLITSALCSLIQPFQAPSDSEAYRIMIFKQQMIIASLMVINFQKHKKIRSGLIVAAIAGVSFRPIFSLMGNKAAQEMMDEKNHYQAKKENEPVFNMLDARQLFPH